MHPLLTVIIPGKPKAKQSFRVSKFGNYQKKDVVEWEAYAAMCALRAWEEQQGEYATLDGPMEIVIDAVWERPKRLQKKGSPQGRIPKTTRPDSDNVAKPTIDALMRCSLVKDDALFWDTRIRRWYAAIGEEAHVEVRIYLDNA